MTPKNPPHVKVAMLHGYALTRGDGQVQQLNAGTTYLLSPVDGKHVLDAQVEIDVYDDVTGEQVFIGEGKERKPARKKESVAKEIARLETPDTQDEVDGAPSA